VVEKLAKVGTGLGFGGFRPEEEGELLARVGQIAVEDEKGEEGTKAVGIDLGDRLLLRVDQQVAK
jgi:hypothetical protein